MPAPGARRSSRLGPQIFAADQPSYIMTYAEYQFILAEAAERGWIAGSAATFYAAGIRASMQQWGVADADITTYLAQPRIVYAGGAAGLAQIGVQKWISLFTQGFEAWSEWRRTGYPNLTPALNAKTAERPDSAPRHLSADGTVIQQHASAGRDHEPGRQ